MLYLKQLGEFGRSLKGNHELHSTTNSWVVLNEK